MAFLGRMNNRDKFIDCEVFSGSRSKLKLNTTMPNYAMDDEVDNEMAHRNSRTYTKTYDSKRRDLVSSPETVRCVGGSASSCEVNSIDDTEMSTLRCISPRSLEVEVEGGSSPTLCLSRAEISSESSSMSESIGYTDGPAAQLKPKQQREMDQLQLERGSTTSLCSWEEEEPMSIYEDDTHPTEQESQICCVPLLELGSDTGSLYYEQQVQLEQLKMMRQSNEAYENWLSGKKRQSQYKQLAEQELREQKEQKEAQRQKLNEQRVREWCAQKARQCIMNPSKRRVNLGKPQSQLNDVALRHLQEWELKKVEQAELQRQQQLRDSLRKQQVKLQREQQAARAWQQWIKGVAQRPKPVPLNQGLKTLRGTVSNIYINPKQWV